MIWAHYDDDLIFANPTLMHTLDRGGRAHACFFTASDAGKGMSPYVDGREAGIRAAYDAMRDRRNEWIDRTITLPHGVTLTLTHPVDDDTVSLSFLRLPDGGLTGGGWWGTGYQTLPKLFSGELPSMTTLDTGQRITVDLLRSTIAHLASAYRPSMVITHHPGYEDAHGEDHPDHQTVGRLVASVVEDGGIPAEIARYAVGYPDANLPANIAPDILRRKLEIFAAYAAHDPVVARGHVDEYLQVRGFGDWLQRHYLERHSGLLLPGRHSAADAESIPG